jgi:hypothetical protein
MQQGSLDEWSARHKVAKPYLLQISNHSQFAYQSSLAIKPSETSSSKPGDWARNMATQFCLQSISTLIGFFYML